MASCLVLLNPGAEEIEIMAVADVLVRAGVTVTVASTASAGGDLVRGSRKLPLCADVSLSDVEVAGFDAVYVPGGVGSAEYARDTAEIQTLLSAQLASLRILAMICAAPISLVPRCLAKGKTLTSYPSIQRTLVDAGATWLDQRVVWDGNLVTSQGPGTAIDLGLSLAAKLTSNDTAEEVAQGMLVEWSPA